jgi:phenylacetate-CoA ligase
MLKSMNPALRWPAVINPAVATIHGFYAQLMQSQWLDPRQLRQMQAVQLAARLEHAAKHSRHFGALLPKEGIDPPRAMELYRGLPLLTRSDLQHDAASVFCEVTPDHGGVQEKNTSGSTGQPVTVKCTAAAFALRSAFTLRSHSWFRLDYRQAFAAIRANVDIPEADARKPQPHWGGPVGALFHTGPSYALNVNVPVGRQAAWLEACRPGYLLTYPSNLQALLQEMPRGWQGMRGIMTIGETAPAELREELRDTWRIPLCDTYSAEELGPVAAQCEHGNYHLMAEGLLVEVVHEDGTPCRPGETGKVVVTDLFNFATATLRYEMRDYAELGDACPCGRQLPVLKRIVGRVRNMMRLPDGRRFWPQFGIRRYGELAPIKQFQVVQTSMTQLEVRVHAARPVTMQEEAAVRARLTESIGHPFEIGFVYLDHELPKGANGKFEQFQCLVP